MGSADLFNHGEHREHGGSRVTFSSAILGCQRTQYAVRARSFFCGEVHRVYTRRAFAQAANQNTKIVAKVRNVA